MDFRPRRGCRRSHCTLVQVNVAGIALGGAAVLGFLQETFEALVERLVVLALRVEAFLKTLLAPAFGGFHAANGLLQILRNGLRFRGLMMDDGLRLGADLETPAAAGTLNFE